MILKDFKGAIEDFSKANDVYSLDFSEACFERAKVKHLLHEYKGAIEDYSKAIESYNEITCIDMATIYLARSNAKRALIDLEGADLDLKMSKNLKND